MIRRLVVITSKGILLLAISCIALCSWIPSTKMPGYTVANFSAMVSYTAHRPFVARVLIPATINKLDELIPAFCIKRMELPFRWIGLEEIIDTDARFVKPGKLIIW